MSLSDRHGPSVSVVRRAMSHADRTDGRWATPEWGLGGSALTWRPLSVREGERPDEGPYEGVPAHLYQPLRQWTDSFFGGNYNSHSDVHNGPRLVAAAHLPIMPSANGKVTVRDVTSAISAEPGRMLDIVDAALHLADPAYYAYIEQSWEELEEILRLGGSVWEINSNKSGLIRRVDPTASKAFEAASRPADVASAELRDAWVAAYGRNPDASDAWDHSIKAVEAVMIPIVTPAKAKATLGDVVGSLNSQGALWQLELRGHDGSKGVEPLVSMLRLMWPNPDRHGGGMSRKPSLKEAEAVVNLAVTLVQWARSGVLSKR
jgi:hypothetical protein